MSDSANSREQREAAAERFAERMRTVCSNKLPIGGDWTPIEWEGYYAFRRELDVQQSAPSSPCPPSPPLGPPSVQVFFGLSGGCDICLV